MHDRPGVQLALAMIAFVATCTTLNAHTAQIMSHAAAAHIVQPHG